MCHRLDTYTYDHKKYFWNKYYLNIISYLDRKIQDEESKETIVSRTLMLTKFDGKISSFYDLLLSIMRTNVKIFKFIYVGENGVFSDKGTFMDFDFLMDS